MHNLVYQGCGGTLIPKTSSSSKSGSKSGAEPDELKRQQDAFELERKKLEIQKEQAILQSDIDRQRAESERDILKTALEGERARTAGFLEQMKQQGEVFFKMLSRTRSQSSEGKSVGDQNSGYVANLVGYHALKRVSADITKGLSLVVGMGNDVRIMIVGCMDYAAGDVPYIEVISQLSVFEVRCRKQVATNKELTDLALPAEERSEEGKTSTIKTGATRLAPLMTAPFVLPPITTAITAIPAVPGLAGTAADMAGYSKSDDSHADRKFHLNTEGLISSVAASLRSDKRYIYVYNFYSMDTTGPQSKLMNMYAGMLDCSNRLAQSRNRLLYYISKKTENLTELKTRLKKYQEAAPQETQEIINLGNEIRRESGWLDRAHMEVLASDAIHAELGTFVKNITSVDPAQGSSKLAQAVFREKVHDLGITHLLYLSVLSSGGESVTKKWLWGSGTTSYLGGSVVSYILSRVEGEVLASEILPVLFTFGYDPSSQKHSPLRQVRFEKPELKK